MDRLVSSSGAQAIDRALRADPARFIVLMADGAVIFMTDSVEAGNSRNPMVWLNGANVGPTPPSNVPGSPSPYGLWGALGTRANRETIEEQLNQ